MPVEIRQLLISSSVGSPTPEAGEPSPERLVQLKAEVLEECRTWLQEQLRLKEER